MAEQAYEGMPADMPQMPQENDDLVVVQALSCRLDEPIGTIVVKSVFDTVFPPKLKGQIDSDTYLVRMGSEQDGNRRIFGGSVGLVFLAFSCAFGSRIW